MRSAGSDYADSLRDMAACEAAELATRHAVSALDAAAWENDGLCWRRAALSDLIGWHPTQLIGDSEVTGLTALPVAEIVLTRTVGISYRRSSVLSPAAILLIDELKRVSAEMIAQKTVMPLP